MRVASAVLFLVLTLRPGAALAHGRPPALHSLDAHPSTPDVLIAQATWGLAVRGGGEWRWLCAAALGVDPRMEDPVIVAGPDGAILAGTFEGLWRSPDGGCTWERPSDDLRDVFAIDVRRVGAETFLLVVSDVSMEDQLWRSEDGGLEWAPVGGFGEVLVDRVRVAPSRPSRVYASGSIPAREGVERQTFLLRSDDGGRSFERVVVPFEPGERLLRLEAIDRTDPELLWATMLHFSGEEAPERVLRSDDGGSTWTSPIAVPQVGGVLATGDGVWVGSRLGGLHRAPDGRAFVEVDPTLPVTCLAEIGGEVWACTDQARAGHGVVRVAPTQAPLLSLSEITELVSCPRCSTSGVVCPAWAADVAYDLGRDASVPFGDGGTGAPRDAGLPAECSPQAGSGCGCRSAGRGAGSPAWLALLALILRRVTKK